QYSSTSQGLAATTNGQYFLLRTADPQVFTVYLNNNGTAVNSGPFSVAEAGVDIAAARTESQNGDYPIAASASESSTNGNRALLKQIVSALADLRLFGLPSSDTYYIERLRRNYQGNWHMVIKRASDNVSVLQ